MNTTTSYPGSATHHAYMDSQHGHMAHGHHQSAAQPYAHYQQSAPMMPHHVSSYAHPPPHHYAYGPALHSPHSVSPHYAPYPQQHHSMSLPAMATVPTPQAAPAPGYSEPERHQDQTGQVSPPGVKPKVTATVWEDEGTLCFQVEADGVCVARREDNHMINGTKLLNVAHMTRGRRDGILKSEKVRNVVKIGPMHLKGVWIPYERALDFANKEKITEKLYPLFVHNVGALLHQPIGQHVAAARRADTNTRSSQTPAVQTPSQQTQSSSLPQQQSIPTPVSSQAALPSQTVSSHGTSARPALDRAHTYPTPPSNTAGGVVGIGTSSSSYDFSGASGSPAQGLVDSKSLPTTPATTPPNSNLQNIQTYHYDSTRNSYSVPPAQQSPYTSVSQNYSYAKGDMAPPSRLKEDDIESRGGYTGDRSYAYSTGVPSSVQLDSNVSPSDLKPTQTSSGRTTPRTIATAPQPSWDTYTNPPHGTHTLPSQHIPYVPSDTRSSGATAMPNGYPNSSVPMLSHAYTYSSAGSTSTKRGREPDDDGSEYAVAASNPSEAEYLKRRKLGHEDVAALVTDIATTTSGQSVLPARATIYSVGLFMIFLLLWNFIRL